MNDYSMEWLSMNFDLRIYRKSGTEFQSFFENIMEKTYSDFQKVKSSGGDGGNDGFMRKNGKYYQVYSPEDPKKVNPSKKLTEDFEKLRTSGWEKVSPLQEYNFVFNDKFSGTTKKIEITMADLKKKHPKIKFELILAKDLKKTFLRLSEPDMLELGFRNPKLKNISDVNELLKLVKFELEKGSSDAYKFLRPIKETASKYDDKDLHRRIEILECACLINSEEVDKAKEKYNSIFKRFRDPVAILSLANIYLRENDLDKNKQCLENAEKIDKSHWLLELSQIWRKCHTKEKIEIEKINEAHIEKYDPIIKSEFYGAYALIFEESGNRSKADEFIEKAIHLRPNSFENWLTKLSILNSRLFSTQDSSQLQDLSIELLDESKKLENKFFRDSDIIPRNKARLNLNKLMALSIQENHVERERIARETFEQAICCYFDYQTYSALVHSLDHFRLNEHQLDELLNRIKKTKKQVPDDLSKTLILQFLLQEQKKLFTTGKKFFEETKNEKYLNLIKKLETQDYDSIIQFLKDNPQFEKVICRVKVHPALREKIIRRFLKGKEKIIYSAQHQFGKKILENLLKS